MNKTAKSLLTKNNPRNPCWLRGIIFIFAIAKGIMVNHAAG
nr:MAG TPA: PROTEIN/RNA Complex PROTEIN, RIBONUCLEOPROTEIN, NUCLEOTIDE-BINDING, PROTEIN [Caudoviricetes sp.]